MSQPPPLPLDYRNPIPPPLPPGGGVTALRFFAALAIGAAVSAIAWIMGWNVVDKQVAALIFIIPGIKVAASIAFFTQRGWRSAGAGLLTSIPIGALIFFGSCAAHMTSH